MFNYNTKNFVINNQHRYGFTPDEDGRYSFKVKEGEVITLPLWNLDQLGLSPSITDLGKVDKKLCDYLRLNFGDEILSTALNDFKRKDMMTWEYIPYETGFYFAINKAIALYLPYLVSHPIRETKGDGWERTVDKLCVGIICSTQYDFWSGKLLKKCLDLKYPWLEKFQISEYSVHSYQDLDEHLVFLPIPDTEGKKKKSVYIPLKALVEADVEAIKKCHTDYFTDYYKWPGGWGKGVTKEDVLGWRQHELDSLETDTFKEFCQYLTETHEPEVKMKKFWVTMTVEARFTAEVTAPEDCVDEELRKAALEVLEDANFGELEDIELSDYVNYTDEDGEFHNF